MTGFLKHFIRTKQRNKKTKTKQNKTKCIYIYIYISVHILDLYCVRLSNAAPFCENYTKLYFDAKHLEKGLKRMGGVKFLVPFFSKKVSFFS